MNLSRFTNPANNEPPSPETERASVESERNKDAAIADQHACSHKPEPYMKHIWRCAKCGQLFGRNSAEWLLGTKMKADGPDNR